MMKRLLVFAAMLGASTAYAASNGGTEFLYQTPANTQYVRADLGYMTGTIKMQNGVHDIDNSGLMPLGVSYQYGLSDAYALGAGINYSSIDSDNGTSTSTQSGLGDLHLNFNGRNDMGMGMLRYGLDLNIGLEKAEVKANGDSNASTGGLGLTPFVGVEMPAGADGFWGLKLSYDLPFSHKVDDKSVGKDYTVTGGETFDVAAYYEHMMGMYRLGAVLDYATVNKSKYKVDGVTTNYGSYSSWNLDVYGRIPVASNIDLIPSIAYATMASDTYKTATNVDSANFWDVNLGARFMF